jgi:hypothetical protein
MQALVPCIRSRACKRFASKVFTRLKLRPNGVHVRGIANHHKYRNTFFNMAESDIVAVYASASPERRISLARQLLGATAKVVTPKASKTKVKKCA